MCEPYIVIIFAVAIIYAYYKGKANMYDEESTRLSLFYSNNEGKVNIDEVWERFWTKRFNEVYNTLFPTTTRIGWLLVVLLLLYSATSNNIIYEPLNDASQYE